MMLTLNEAISDQHGRLCDQQIRLSTILKCTFAWSDIESETGARLLAELVRMTEYQAAKVNEIERMLADAAPKELSVPSRGANHPMAT